GELDDQCGPELVLSEREGALAALTYFDHAIALRPDYAEAYAEKAIALLHLEDDEGAIRSADQGLAVFDTCPTLDSPLPIWTNIGESLYRAKALALQESGRAESGRRTLEEGLERFPGSEYLTQIVDR